MGLFHRKPKTEKKKLQRGTVDYNAHKNRKKYPLNGQGYFVVKGKSRGKSGQKQAVRVIESKNQYTTAKDFYSKISRGGKESSLPNAHGKRKDLSDKTVIVYREQTSSPNSPAVSLNTKKIRRSKAKRFILKKVKVGAGLILYRRIRGEDRKMKKDGKRDFITVKTLKKEVKKYMKLKKQKNMLTV